MKKLIIIAVCLFETLFINANPCDSIFPPLGYSTGSHTFCIPGTSPSEGGWRTYVNIYAEYADTYTFVTEGGNQTVNSSISFTPTEAGITTFTLYGISNASVQCFQSVVFSFTTFVCENAYHGDPVGIPEINYSSSVAIKYYDLQGNTVERRVNELIIEQRGNSRKKVFILP